MDQNKIDSLLQVQIVADARAVMTRKRKGRYMQAQQKIALYSGIWYLSVRGYLHTEIAAVLECSKQNIQKHLKRATDDAMTNLYAEMEYEKRQNIMKYKFIYQQAIEAWELSKGGKKKQTRKSYEIPDTVDLDNSAEINSNTTDKKIIEITTTLEANVVGDPKHLMVAMKALERAEKLMGMNITIEDNMNWHSKLASSGYNPEKIFDIIVIDMQGKLLENKGIDGGDGEYAAYTDPNVLNAIDAKFEDIEGGNREVDDE